MDALHADLEQAEPEWDNGRETFGAFFRAMLKDAVQDLGDAQGLFISTQQDKAVDRQRESAEALERAVQRAEEGIQQTHSAVAQGVELSDTAISHALKGVHGTHELAQGDVAGDKALGLVKELLKLLQHRATEAVGRE